MEVRSVNSCFGEIKFYLDASMEAVNFKVHHISCQFPRSMFL